MGKSRGGSTTVRNDIPAELSPLFQTGAANIQALQGLLPLTDFTGTGAFGSADRAGQFGVAEDQIRRSQSIAGQAVPSRFLLDQRPAGTTRASNVAQAAQRAAGHVPGEFRMLHPVAQRQVGLQGLEQDALRRAGTIPGVVGQTPGQFGDTLATFNRGIDPLQAEARQVPGQFQNTLNTFQQGIDPLQALAGTVSGQFGDTRNTANIGIQDLIGQADRQITGEGLMESPALQAAIQAFETSIMPTIQNQAALSGLGRTTGLPQSLAAAQAQFMLPVIQGELARQERGLERGLGARQFGISTAADLGLQEALAEERGTQRATDIGRFGLATEADLGLQDALARERGIQRGVDVGQFGLATAADLGLQEALAAERGIQRRGTAEQFAAGIAADIGSQLAGRQENQINRELAALGQIGAANERGLQRNQAASQFLAGIEQASGQQDLMRALESIGADERSRALAFEQSQAAIPQLMQLGASEQSFLQGIEDRQTQDFLRRQALAEQALFQPFGMIAPSAIGQRSTNSGKKDK